MWRWSDLLPFDGSADYPLPVGGTPLLVAARLNEWLGLKSLWLKDESRGPSGSNKDRATAITIVDARRKSMAVIACASTGNVASSLAVGAAAVGLTAVLFVSRDGVSPQKERFMRAFGATVVKVRGTYEDAYRLSEAACRTFGWYSRNTGINPLTVQGKKTVAFEIWEQLGRQVPDHVFVPVGDGVTIAALGLGFDELVRCGVADRIPRLIGVQADGAAPLAAAYRSGEQWKAGVANTYADGISVGDPQFGTEALVAVRKSRGEFVTVTDNQMRHAVALLAKCGMLFEPAGAASVAAIIRARAMLIDSGGRTVALLTGAGLKDPRWWPDERGATFEVSPDAELSALEAIGARVRQRMTTNHVVSL
jgi:threonine synthase